MRLIFLLLTFSLTGFANDIHVEMSAELTSIQDTSYIAINLKNEKGWHTYWKNPGDAGLPIEFEFFSRGEKLSLEPLPWPVPKTYIEGGGILAYGYELVNTFFFKSNKASFPLKISAKWLVCKEICIPGEGELTLNSKTSTSGKTLNLDYQNFFKALPFKKPRPRDLEVFVQQKEDGKLWLQYTYPLNDLSELKEHANFIFPFPTTPLDFKKEELYYDQQNKVLYGLIPFDWDGEFEDPPMELPKNGVFESPIQIQLLFNGPVSSPLQFTYQLSEFSTTGAQSFESFLTTIQKVGEEGSQKSFDKASPGLPLWQYILFALLGGLILNLMPCVLPVISLKLFALVSHAGESKKSILRHNTFYTLGVLFCFWLLALSVVLLKVAGQQVGWGFQLQSPSFVFIMLIILFVMTLNMFGLFEFATPGGRTLGGKKLEDSFLGDFFSGVLATILSTPCSAPFLGTALTFAFTTSTFNIFMIFTFVGIGLAFPFILVAFFPKTLKFLPKPGNWMVHLKYFLGLTLLITYLWLGDVFFGLTSYDDLLLPTAIFFSLLFFGFFFKKQIGGKFIVLFFILPVIALYPIVSMLDHPQSLSTNSTGQTSEWKKWNEAEMLNTEGFVFVDFTAKWCLTCKVNKKLVLNTDAFADLVSEFDITLMQADWTKRDDYITQFLKRYNLVGVPAYFLKTPEGEVISLGEIVSIQGLKAKLSE